MTAKQLTETQIKTIKNVRAFVKAFVIDDKDVMSAPGRFAALEIDGAPIQIIQTAGDFGVIDISPFAFDDRKEAALKKVNWVNESVIAVLAGKTKQDRVKISSSFYAIRTVVFEGHFNGQRDFYDFAVEGTLNGVKFTLNIFDPASSYDDVLTACGKQSDAQTAKDPLNTITRRDLGRMCEKFQHEGNDEVALQIAGQLLDIDNSRLQALIKRELSSNTGIFLEASELFGWPDDNEVGAMTCVQAHDLREACMDVGRAEQQLATCAIAREPYKMCFDRSYDAPTPVEQQLIDLMNARKRDVRKIVDKIMATKPAPSPVW